LEQPKENLVSRNFQTRHFSLPFVGSDLPVSASCFFPLVPWSHGRSTVPNIKKVEPGSEATRFLFENSLNRRAQAEGRDTIRLQVGISQREADTRLGQLNQDAAAIAQGAELHRRRGELTARAEHLEKQRTDLGAQLETLERELQELKREETNQSALTANARQGQSLIALAARYREVAGEIRARAAEQLRLKISEHVGDLWVAITERHQEFLGIDFDPDWNCFLLRRDGRRVSWEQTNTSAGQRQVRTLAFFEALRRLARLVPPLVVDTPLGRLDKEVKDSVLDQLYLTGHQTIILTTNSEIDPDSPLFQRIQKKLARVYTLHPQGEENTLNYQVRVTNDYFGKSL
jgi:DNA sulfur modification protein DndD